MQQQGLRALNDKTRQDWLDYCILAGGTALVGLAAVGTLGHRVNKHFAPVVAVPGANPDEDGAKDGGKSTGTTDAGTVVRPVRPTAADGAKIGDEEDSFD